MPTRQTPYNGLGRPSPSFHTPSHAFKAQSLTHWHIAAHSGATPIPSCLPGRRRPPCTPAAHPASHAHQIAPRAAAQSPHCHPAAAAACRRRHPPPHPAIPTPSGAPPPLYSPCRHPFHPPSAAALARGSPARHAPPRTSRLCRRPSPASISIFGFKVCVPATKLAIQTPKRQPGAEGKAVMKKKREA